MEVTKSHNIKLPDASLPPHQPLGDTVSWNVHPHTDIVPVNKEEASVHHFGDLKEVLREVEMDILLSLELGAEKLINHIVKVRRGCSELSHITVQSVTL